MGEEKEFSLNSNLILCKDEKGERDRPCLDSQGEKKIITTNKITGTPLILPALLLSLRYFRLCVCLSEGAEGKMAAVAESPSLNERVNDTGRYQRAAALL